MPISYTGLPGKRCSTCSSGLFARFGNVLRCGQCQPLADGEAADEWLESAYERGVLRWVAALPPSPPMIASVWLYVAENLDWVEIDPSDEIADVWHFDRRWFRKLDRRLLAWLYSVVLQLGRHSFQEDLDDALNALRCVVARGVETGVFTSDFADESRWPRSPGGFDPFGGLPDLNRIDFPRLRILPVATSLTQTTGKGSFR